MKTLPVLAATLAHAASDAPEPALEPNQAEAPAPAEALPEANLAEAPAPAPPVAAPPAATPAPAPKPAAAWSKSGYRLVGTEPFWGGTVKGARILYMTPENQAGEPVAATAAYGASLEAYRGTLEGKPFVLTLTAGPCSDGMSDKVHAFTATLQVRGETRNGCADPL